MAKSDKAVVWGLFAAGGTLTAFIIPVLVFITGLAVPLGIMNPEILSYDRMQAFLGNWISKIIVFGILFLSLWHAAHRMRVTLHDFGIRSDLLAAIVLYTLAGVGSVAAIVYLVQI